MDDPYLDAIYEQFDHILMVYKQVEDKKPIIEYDIRDKKIYSYIHIQQNNTLMH
jgi:hypothetical protein